MPINVLFFGAHPDDVEWSVGGIALLLQQRNVPFAVVDLTRGELGSRGTVEERAVEAKQAAEFMGSQSRENLNLPDGGLVDSLAYRSLIARSIPLHRSRIVVRNSALYCSSSSCTCTTLSSAKLLTSMALSRKVWQTTCILWRLATATTVPTLARIMEKPLWPIVPLNCNRLRSFANQHG